MPPIYPRAEGELRGGEFAFEDIEAVGDPAGQFIRTVLFHLLAQTLPKRAEDEPRRQPKDQKPDFPTHELCCTRLRHASVNQVHTPNDVDLRHERAVTVLLQHKRRRRLLGEFRNRFPVQLFDEKADLAFLNGIVAFRRNRVSHRKGAVASKRDRHGLEAETVFIRLRRFGFQPPSASHATAAPASDEQGKENENREARAQHHNV